MLAVTNESIQHIFSQVEVYQYFWRVTAKENKSLLGVSSEYCDQSQRLKQKISLGGNPYSAKSHKDLVLWCEPEFSSVFYEARDGCELAATVITL